MSDFENMIALIMIIATPFLSILGSFLIALYDYKQRKRRQAVRDAEYAERKKIVEQSFRIVSSVHSNDVGCDFVNTMDSLHKNLDRLGMKLNVNLGGITNG